EHALGRLVQAAQVGRDLAACAEGGIEAAVDRVTGQGQIRLAAGEVGADRDELAVRLQGKTMNVVELAEVGRDDAGAVKGGIEGPVAVVAHEDEAEAAAAGGGVASRDDLAVSL